MSLVLSELRLRRVSILTWVVAVALLVLMMAGLYPSIKDQPSLNDIYAGLSTSAQALLGGSNVTSPAGYLSTQLYAFFLPAILLVFMLGRSAATIAGEEEDRTLDLLMAQPLPRWSAYGQKAIAVAVSLFALCAATTVVLLALNDPAGLNLAVSDLLAVNVQLFLFCLALGAWTQAISAATGRKSLGLSVVIGYTLVAYIVYGLGQSISWLEHFVPASLWRWYLSNDPLTNGFGLVECAVLVAVTAVGVLVGMVFFQRRELHA